MNTETIVKYMLSLAEDKAEYRQRVERDFIVHKELLSWLKSEEISFQIIESKKNPEVRLIIFCDSYNHNDFNAKYNYVLYFSKFMTLYKDEIQFIIKNPDKGNYVGESFIGEESMPLTSKQERIISKVKEYLASSGFTYLFYRDYSTVICDLNYVVPEMNLYGNQPTINVLLFNDFFDLIN
jgi:hypothetical protein